MLQDLTQSTATVPLPVLISLPIEGRRLSQPKWLVAYRGCILIVRPA